MDHRRGGISLIKKLSTAFLIVVRLILIHTVIMGTDRFLGFQLV